MFNTPYEVDYSNRNPHPKTDPLFSNRWSPRSFKKTEISKDVLDAIFDAARWSPSAYNEQPWLFLASDNEVSFNKFLDTLIEMNQGWAKNASVLGYIVYKNNFTENGKLNPWAAYDCGFAWASLTFQASKFGLFTHGMAGFDTEKAHSSFNIPKDSHTIIAAFAIGAIDVPEHAPEPVQFMEAPNARKDLGEVYFPNGEVSINK